MTSNKSELEAIIMQFKVTDLSTLLAFAGQNKIGRKGELQKRALNLIRNRVSIPLEMKIRNIYRQILHDNQKNSNSSCVTNRYDCNYYTNDFSFQSSGAYSSARSFGINYFSNYRPKNNTQNYNCVNPFDDATPQHRRPNGVNFNYSHHLEAGLHIPEPRKLHGLQFKELPFYDRLKDVVPLTAVIPDKKTTDMFEYLLPFQISEADHTCLKKSSEKDDRLQLQLRFCLLNETTVNSNQLEDSLPLAVVVQLNDRYVQLPPPIPSTNKQGMLLKRFNFPINITPQCSKKNRVNNLFVSWSTQSKLLYGLTIHLVEKFSSDELISKLKVRSADVTQDYISQKLKEDDDIEATSLKVTLTCPLGKIRMNLPSRGTTCEHVQCFDAGLYIKMNEVKSVWQCPVCNKTCLYENLLIDEYFLSILKCDTLCSNVLEIQINSDCSWEPVIERKRKHEDEHAETESIKKCKTELMKPCSYSENSVDNDTGSRCDELPTINSVKEGRSSLEEKNILDITENSRSNSPPSNYIFKKDDVVLVDLISDDESEVDVIQINSSEKLCKDSTTPCTSLSQTNSNPPIFDVDDSD